MSIVVRFTPPSLSKAQYDESVRRLTDAGIFPADGLSYHICFGEDGALRVSEVWDSRAQWEAFTARLMPILTDVGISPGEPEVHEVHNVIQR